MLKEQNGYAGLLNSGVLHSTVELPLSLKTQNGAAIYRISYSAVKHYRHMVTRIMRDRDFPKRLAVVSALREEGVTYTSLALATTIAHDLERSVCVVDLNWWWPSRTMRILRDSSPGLSSVLYGEANLENVLVHTTDPNLTLLPAGDLFPAQRPVIARGKPLHEQIQRLSEQFDHLILDIPAVLATSDAVPLASLGTDCCMVVRQGVSNSTSTGRALDEISHLSVVGVVMNQVKIATPSWLLKWIPQD